MDFYTFFHRHFGKSCATAQDEKIDRATNLNDLEKKFVSEAKKIGRKHKCFFEAMRDDNCIYIQLQPAMDFTKHYRESPTLQEDVEDFKKFRKELDELAERIGCYKMSYTCEPNYRSISEKTKNGRDYMNFLSTKVKDAVWKHTNG